MFLGIHCFLFSMKAFSFHLWIPVSYLPKSFLWTEPQLHTILMLKVCIVTLPFRVNAGTCTREAKEKIDLWDLNGLIVIINRNLLDLRKGFEWDARLIMLAVSLCRSLTQENRREHDFTDWDLPWSRHELRIAPLI